MRNFYLVFFKIVFFLAVFPKNSEKGLLFNKSYSTETINIRCICTDYSFNCSIWSTDCD